MTTTTLSSAASYRSQFTSLIESKKERIHHLREYLSRTSVEVPGLLGSYSQDGSAVSTSLTDAYSAEDYLTFQSSDMADQDELLGVQRRRQQPEQPQPSRHDAPANVLPRIPNTAFGIAMGLAGNAIMWKAVGAAQVFNAEDMDTQVVNEILWLAALAVASIVALCYCYKAIFRWELVRQEWKCAVRVHFMNAPHLLAIMLAMGAPPRIEVTQRTMQIVFGVGLACQTFITQFIYDHWLFNPQSNISTAKPPFLLSTVGWFLLANLGLAAKIPETWGLALPQFCLGIGAMFYLMVTIAILNGLHHNRRQMRGSPSLTLLLAPPSVGIIALDMLDDDPTSFSTASSLVLGWILVLFLLFAKIGPRIAQDPGVLGEYWAYVFPLAAVATAWIRYAAVVQTTAATVVAVLFWSIAMVALLAVLVRMFLHTYRCIRHQAQWGDPVLGISSKVVVPSPPTSPSLPSDEEEEALNHSNQV